jgi:hypothetical protein
MARDCAPMPRAGASRRQHKRKRGSRGCDADLRANSITLYTFSGMAVRPSTRKKEKHAPAASPFQLASYRQILSVRVWGPGSYRSGPERPLPEQTVVPASARELTLPLGFPRAIVAPGRWVGAQSKFGGRHLAPAAENFSIPRRVHCDLIAN